MDASPNLDDSPTFLAVYTRADPKTKFTVGENREIYLLDLKTLKFIRLAHAPRHPAGTGLVAGGAIPLLDAQESNGDNVVTSLYAHDTVTGKTRRLTRTETGIEEVVMDDGFLLANIDGHLCAIDLTAEDAPSIRLTDDSGGKCDIWGKMVAYTRDPAKGSLSLVPMPLRKRPATSHPAPATAPASGPVR